MPIQIITTEDGSHSLFDEKLNETYHSTKGARGESMHVFIKEGLEYILSQKKIREINILEIGLGTGLNSLLTAIYSKEHHQAIHFTALEPFPIAQEIYKILNYPRSRDEKLLLEMIHQTRWGENIEIFAGFSFYKTMQKLEKFSTSQSFNLIYFDAFAPSKQPEIWSIENLKRCYNLLNKHGILTTYCAQGQFKRHLTEVGFTVETLEGAMGKKEMVRAVKPY